MKYIAVFVISLIVIFAVMMRGAPNTGAYGQRFLALYLGMAALYSLVPVAILFAVTKLLNR